MYTLPNDFDVSIFNGRILELVCFAQYSVSLHFNDNLFITVEGKLEYQRSSRHGTGNVDINAPIFESGLRSLLGRSVSEAKAFEDGTLELTFINGATVNILGDNGPYESYHLNFNGRVITV